MLELPIPIFVSLVLVFLLVQGLWLQRLPRLIAALLAVCAAQAMLNSLTQHYGIMSLLPVQVLNASAIPPLAYLSFTSLAVRRLEWPRDLIHVLGPLVVVLLLSVAPTAIDFAIVPIFVGYGVAMFIQMRAGTDTLLKSRLEGGDVSLIVWRVIAAFLILSALADIAISLSIQFDLAGVRTAIISVAYSVQLLVIGGFSLSRVEAEDVQEETVAEKLSEPDTDEVALVDRLRGQMQEAQWFTEPELTLNKLARRLVVPTKTLSRAVNNVTGQNVSRFVNEYRIAHACAGLKAEESSITAVMFDAGFETKSNFNREFRRIKGKSPSDWLIDQS